LLILIASAAKGPAVQAVEDVHVDVVGQLGRLSDPRDEDMSCLGFPVRSSVILTAWRMPKFPQPGTRLFRRRFRMSRSWFALLDPPDQVVRGEGQAVAPGYGSIDLPAGLARISRASCRSGCSPP
jgi:hypothetical protein